MPLFDRESRFRQIKRSLTIDIGYFQQNKWQLVTLFDKITGMWPYQSRLSRALLRTFHFLVLLTLSFALINRFRDLLSTNTTLAIECMLTNLFVVGLMIKFTAATLLQKTRQKIYEKIVEHFQTLNDPEEASTLNEHAEQGFRYTAAFLCVACTFVFLFDSIPMVKSFHYNYFTLGKFETVLPLQMDYGVDHRKYIYWITLHFSAFVCSGVFIDAMYDFLFILQVRHVQALFKIVRVRLNKASQLAKQAKEDGANDAYSILVGAVNLHIECFDLIDTIEKKYTACFFFLLLLNVGLFGALIHVVNENMQDPIESFRSLCAFLLIFMHFLVVFYQGQLIIDSSSTIAEACYECEWYNLPKKSQVVLLLMMMRSKRPCQITGLNFFTLSMEVFSQMSKAGLSYYTLFEQ